MGGSCNERTPPLKVVLGAFGGSLKSEPSLTTLAAAAVAGEGSPVAYILGTSYFATPWLGPNIGNRQLVLRLNKDSRVLMEDRKGPFDHFRPKSLVLSVSLSFVTGRASIRDQEGYICCNLIHHLLCLPKINNVPSGKG